MDKLFITDLRFHGHCGISEDERRSGQRLSVDVELILDLGAASRSDHLRDTVNYADVASRIVAIGREEKFSLIEALAVRIAEDLLGRYPVEEAVIRVHKCLPPVEAIQGTFGIEIRRRCGDFPSVPT
jgi:dihydroneopterin aldolase